ncbi:hypothetical protein C1645_809164 [Glomus cerebriforme]|uniref:Uncharacterized protein n=1 Tax=Glomus cerebriforme TaxID=658196 RepID=A0A397SH69_9GLOM|nr:hypothetical protein C1645_809164 [Glomus cerebriforme]
MPRVANAYLQFRKCTINPKNKRKMTVHSKFTGTEWNKLSDYERRKFYQVSAKEALKKEAASGRNGFTKKSFEQCGIFAFINEFPIQSGKVDIDTNCEENIFERYTINTDYIE